MHYTYTDFTCAMVILPLTILYFTVKSETFTSIMLGAALSCLLPTGCEKARADTVQSTITQTAIENGIDPNLALAVAEVESGLNPKAKGKAGEIGLFQLHPRFFPNASFNVKKNSELGIRHLIYWQEHCPTKTKLTWINCFNRGTKPVVNPKTTPYYKKFIKAYRRRTLPAVASVR